jgi:hypothetical protein
MKRVYEETNYSSSMYSSGSELIIKEGKKKKQEIGPILIGKVIETYVNVDGKNNGII